MFKSNERALNEQKWSNYDYITKLWLKLEFFLKIILFSLNLCYVKLRSSNIIIVHQYKFWRPRLTKFEHHYISLFFGGFFASFLIHLIVISLKINSKVWKNFIIHSNIIVFFTIYLKSQLTVKWSSMKKHSITYAYIKLANERN